MVGKYMKSLPTEGRDLVASLSKASAQSGGLGRVTGCSMTTKTTRWKTAARRQANDNISSALCLNYVFILFSFYEGN